MGTPTILLDLIGEQSTQADAPSVPTQEADMAATIHIPRADRPYNDLLTKPLVEQVLALDPIAVLEAQMRLCHAQTLKPHNRRMLVKALATIASAPEAPEEAPEEEPKVRSAKSVAADRLKALGAYSVKGSIRVNHLVDAGIDVETLSDEQLVAVAAVSR